MVGDAIDDVCRCLQVDFSTSPAKVQVVKPKIYTLASISIPAKTAVNLNGWVAESTWTSWLFGLPVGQELQSDVILDSSSTVFLSVEVWASLATWTDSFWPDSRHDVSAELPEDPSKILLFLHVSRACAFPSFCLAWPIFDVNWPKKVWLVVIWSTDTMPVLTALATVTDSEDSWVGKGVVVYY